MKKLNNPFEGDDEDEFVMGENRSATYGASRVLILPYLHWGMPFQKHSGFTNQMRRTEEGEEN
jgi:hypothetical protein